MDLAKWLQTATSTTTTELTHSICIRLARLVRSCFIKNAPRLASLGAVREIRLQPAEFALLFDKFNENALAADYFFYGG
jgi:hypothetical protein